MATNKNAMLRIAILDALLSDRHHNYDINDLTDKCNQSLAENDVPPVTSRCIQKDLNFIEGSSLGGNIERIRLNGKNCIRYEDPSFSIFKGMF